jgi:DNA-binding response OmpR family regulator
METYQAPAGARIAIIEDDKSLRDALAAFLRVKGWLVDTFESGEESLRAVNWDDFTAVISDFVLGRENGLSVLRRVMDASDKIVTVLITSYPGGNVSAQAKAAGVERILCKPFSTMELVESLAAPTKNKSSRRSAASASPQ